MSFIWPELLWSLVLVPLLTVMYFRMQQHRREAAIRFGSLGFVQQAVGGNLNSRRHIPAILFLVGLTVLFVSLARPQMVIGLPKVEGIVILAFDVSGSMAAQDFEPTRLDAAREVAVEFVNRQPSTVRIGVVEFSDSGFSTLTPSSDRELVIKAIDRLKIQQGTSLANGIVVSLNSIATITGQEPIANIDQLEFPVRAEPGVPTQPEEPPTPAKIDDSAVIIMLTDGENNTNPDPMVAARIAAERGVRIHTIGVGSPQGTVLAINGFSIYTQLNEPLLKAIAERTGGLYYNAKNEEDLREIYKSIEPRLKIAEEETEITSVLAGISIIFLLLGGVISLIWFNRIP